MNISKISFSNMNFARRNKGAKAPVTSGLDYRPHTIKAAGKSESRNPRDEFIINRISKIMEDADTFVKKHPEYQEEEIIQDLLLQTTEIADSFEPSRGKSIDKLCTKAEQEYFTKLAQKPKFEVDSFEEHKETPSNKAHKL